MRYHSLPYRLSAVLVLAAVFLACWPASAAEKKKEAKQYDPHITYLFPAGGQRATTLQTMIRGRGLEGASAVRVSGKGVTAKILAIEEPDTKLQQRSKNRQDQSENPNVVRLSVAIAADAELGERDLRLLTPKGASNRFRFIVGQIAEVNEVEPNDKLDQVQSLPSLPVLVNGQVFQGDRDVFQFTAKAGQTLVLDVRARMLLPYIADAVPGWLQSSLTLYDSAGKELAYCDDFRFHPDPLLIYKVKKDGRYLVEIKDVLYRGREDLVYRLSIGALPFITHVFPLGGRRGAGTRVELHGVNLPAPSTNLALPADCPTPHCVQADRNGLTSNALPFAVDDIAEMTETEPNNSAERANKIETPVAINGRIEQPGDVDCFLIGAKEKQRLVMEVWARRLESPLDSMLAVFNLAKRRELVSNDDTIDASYGLITHHCDSRLEYTFPAAGDYVLQIQDVQGHGGQEYAYRLVVARRRPDFALRIVPDNPPIAQGGTGAIKVKAFRRDGFDGEINLAVENLPEGCVLSDAVIGAKAPEVRFTLTAPDNAPLGVFSPTVKGTAKIGDQAVVRRATPSEDLMQAFIYWHNVPSKEFLPSIVKPKPFALAIAENKVLEIPQGGQVEVPIKLVRKDKEKAKGAVSLKADTPPKGVTVKGGNIPPNKTDAVITITALKQVPVGFRDNVIIIGTMKAGKQSVTCVAPAIPIKVVAAQK